MATCTLGRSHGSIAPPLLPSVPIALHSAHHHLLSIQSIHIPPNLQHSPSPPQLAHVPTRNNLPRALIPLPLDQLEPNSPSRKVPSPLKESTGQRPSSGPKGASQDSSDARTLYVGNLNPAVSEELLMAVFNHVGPVRSCKLIYEAGNDPYCFVEFADRAVAEIALNTMNRRQCLGKEMKINWASSPGSQSKIDTSKHYHIFVGDLSPEIETHSLREAFAPFGEISDCRVVRDLHTLKSKGYGFVSFVKKTDAETAIASMNGQWIGSRNIRTNWATRKPPVPKNNDAQKPLTFDDVYNQSSPTNCTVYCGGIASGLCEDLMQKTFSNFGQIQEIRVFKDKGYAFIRFSTKESATHAIVSVHNTEVGGQLVKCSWGKESGDPNNTPVTTQVMPLAGSQFPYNYAGQMGYWYPQGYPPQVQGQQILGMQGFAYGQYGYQQGIAGMTGVPAWQGVPQPQLPAGQIPQIQQPAASVLGAYPVQQFQLSSPYVLGSTPGTLVQ